MKARKEEIDEYIQAVSDSKMIGRAPRRLSILEHLIQAEVNGQGDKLKAYSIGLDVFDKPNDFDPSIDSTVRVEIGRLRTAIKLFEASEFATTAIRVEIPVGTYRPTISYRDDVVHNTRASGVENDPSPAPLKPRNSKWRMTGMTLVIAAIVLIGILQFLSVTLYPEEKADASPKVITLQIQDFSQDALGADIALAIRRSFANNKTVTILASPHGESVNIDAEYVVRGRIRPNGQENIINAELLDAVTNRLIWSKEMRLAEADKLEEKINASLSGELHTRLFGASKEALEGQDPYTLTPQQLFVMATWVPGPALNAFDWELERVRLMRIALEKAPQFGAAHSVLADKLSFLANSRDLSDTKENHDMAKYHAIRAIELAPFDADALFNVAQYQWHSGQISASQHTFNRVVELDHSNAMARFLALVVPYTCETAPDDALEAAIIFDRQLSADNPIRWVTLTWIGRLHAYRDELEPALKAESDAALIFQVPYTSMRRAMVLNELGRSDEAAELLRHQRKNWPGIDPAHFATRTVPRQCSEASNPEPVLRRYRDLASVMKGQLD